MLLIKLKFTGAIFRFLSLIVKRFCGRLHLYAHKDVAKSRIKWKMLEIQIDTHTLMLNYVYIKCTVWQLLVSIIEKSIIVWFENAQIIVFSDKEEVFTPYYYYGFYLFNKNYQGQLTVKE